jgi:hypothetical protein
MAGSPVQQTEQFENALPGALRAETERSHFGRRISIRADRESAFKGGYASRDRESSRFDLRWENPAGKKPT